MLKGEARSWKAYDNLLPCVHNVAFWLGKTVGDCISAFYWKATRKILIQKQRPINL